MLSRSLIDGGRRALALGLLISAAVLAPASARPMDNPEVILDLDSSVGISGALAQGRDGQLYGAGYVGGWAVFRVVPGSRLEALHVFTEAEGSMPSGGLLLGADGNFYGATSHGGAFDLGTIYRVSPEGKFKLLHSFTAADGRFPHQLLQAQDGQFYGTMSYGGSFNRGTAYRMTPNGKFTVVHDFGATEADTPYPGSLMQASDGAFYGAAGGGRHNCGTILKMHRNGQVRVIHDFKCDGSDGNASDSAPMTEGPDGLLYGVGQGRHGAYKHGLIFRIDKEGRQYEVVYDFPPPRRLNGRDPSSRLTLGHDGALYGTTSYGTDDRVGGTIYRLTADGTLTTLYQFDYFSRVGAATGGPLLETENGVFVGRTAGGGELNAGSVYRFTVPAD
jgi:uncharacterized repeat protein (TIGR03803 family)